MADQCKLWVNLCPQQTNGKDDFTKPPIKMPVSIKSSMDWMKNLNLMPPVLLKRVKDYLHHHGFEIGKSEVIETKEKQKRDLWISKEKGIVQRPVIRGVTNNRDDRQELNMMFMMEAENVLELDTIYLAGVKMRTKYEYRVKHRLVTYAEMSKDAKIL